MPGISSRMRLMGVHNPIGALVAERAGFDGVWVSGLEVSAAFGVPDADLVTMSEMLEVSRGIAERVTVPVIVDGDSGYGNVNNVRHAVARFQDTRVAGICMEDKVFPKMNSFVPFGQVLMDPRDFAAKIAAARDVIRGDDFLLIARVEALIAGLGVDDALDRARRYEAAGAGAILIHDKIAEPDRILEFAERWESETPLVAVPTTYNATKASELFDAGISIVIYANHGLRASIHAMDTVMRSILAYDRTLEIESRIASVQDVFALQGVAELAKNEIAYQQSDEQLMAFPAR